jgi:hypothetical protein
MSAPNEPSRIIESEAKTILGPMGVKQKGRSRTWLDDRGWWLGVVEFQPSSFSKGSYLNVGCMWFWHVKPWISYDLGHRVENHVEFHNEAQFRPEARRLAQKAAREIERWRKTLPSVTNLCSYYARQMTTGNIWPEFNAAIACALGGNGKLSQGFFEKIASMENLTTDWAKAAVADAKELSGIASDREQFRRVIVERIHRCRAAHKLAELPAIDFG